MAVRLHDQPLHLTLNAVALRAAREPFLHHKNLPSDSKTWQGPLHCHFIVDAFLQNIIVIMQSLASHYLGPDAHNHAAFKMPL
jgi:hypothetical protein